MEKFDKFIFLIGGMDLEMSTIIELLNSNNLNYIDKQLQWGATLSVYQSYFNDENIFVGIELIEDIDPPKNYICIDHHNENSYKPASLQQIADLLEITLNRNQLLICANDAGYIPAMEAMGATKEEIESIRREDRLQQGVTEEDERLAVLSIKENLTIKNDITIVEALTPRFSTITDILFPYNKLLISFQDHLVYYGDGVDKIENRYQVLISRKKAFCGGGKSGFFGISKGQLSMDEIELIKNEIMEQSKIIKKSSHIFMFPFSFYTSFEKAVCAVNENEDWMIADFKINNAQRFNQHIYFHDFAEKILMPSNQNKVGCWEYKNLGSDAHYYIQIKEIDKPFDLNLTRISLYLFNTQIGVLSFYLDNYHTNDPEDILKINEFGRRLFPQYLEEGSNLIDACQSNFLPKSITISRKSLDDSMIANFKTVIDDKHENIIAFDDFSYYRCFPLEDHQTDIRKEMSVKLPNHILKIIGEKHFSDFESLKIGKIFIKPLIDDRMFVLSCFINSPMVEKLQKFQDGHYGYELFNNEEWVELSSQECKSWENSKTHPFSEIMKTERKELDFWYRYIFIDKNQSTSQSIHQITDLINKHTYDRWINWGTLYGVSRYSFVIITGSQGEFDRKFDMHLNTLYFYLALSSLVERSSILRFSERVTSIAPNDKFDLKTIEIENIISLYHDYIIFINNIHLREITAQEQGIELYNMLLEKMNIKQEVEFLDNEIAELHNYVSMYEDRERNRKMANLSLLATFFLPATLVAAIFGFSFITSQTPFYWFGSLEPKVFNAVLVVSLFGVLGIAIFKLSTVFTKIKRKIGNFK